MTNAIDIASYIVARRDTWLDNFTLQKLVYFSQAWSLGWTGKPLIEDTFEAWPKGPVDRDLWVCQRYTQIPAYTAQLTDSQAEIVDAVLEYYSDKNRIELINLSHEDAWSEARGTLSPTAPSQNKLRTETIRDYYARLAIAGEGPARTRTGRFVRTTDANEASRRVMERWQEGLALLASR